jgi:hypothetical protein
MNERPPVTEHFDIFLSHGERDGALATVVKQRLEDFGLSVFVASDAELLVSPEAAAAARQALVGSSAFVALLTPSHKGSPNLTFELGVAWGRGVPVHILVAGDELSQIPDYMRRYKIHPLSEFSALIAELTRGAKPVSATSGP